MILAGIEGAARRPAFSCEFHLISALQPVSRIIFPYKYPIVASGHIGTGSTMANTKTVPDLPSALFEARVSGRRLTLEWGSELSSDEALAIQLEVLAKMVAHGEELGGWKIGLTSGAGRDALGAGFRPFGYILKSRILHSGAQVALASETFVVEPEICLVMGRDLRGDQLDRAAVMAAVKAVAPAFEIIQQRTSRGGPFGVIVADGLSNWGIVVGEEVSPTLGLLSTLVEVQDQTGPLPASDSYAAKDDPYVAVSRLCAALHKYGLGLEAGQKIITGAFSDHSIKAPTTLRADFSGIGEVKVAFV